MEIADFEPKIMEILRSSDMATVTTKTVRKQLQLGTEMSLDDHKKPLKELIEKCYEKVNNENASLKNKAVQRATVPSKRKAPTVKREKKKKEIDPTAKEKKNPLQRKMGLSPELRALTGEIELSRPEVVKKLWDYIRDLQLQDPADKRYILCDEKLMQIFNQEKRIHCFTMNKYLGKHLQKLPEEVQNKNE